MKKLTTRQIEMLTFLEVWFSKNRKHPPMKLLVYAVGGSCSTDAYRVLRALARKGFLTWTDYRIKTVSLTSGKSGGVSEAIEECHP